MEAYTEQWLIFKEEIANFQQRERELCAPCCNAKPAFENRRAGKSRANKRTQKPLDQVARKQKEQLDTRIYTLLSTQPHLHRNQTLIDT
jgi:hypothetical protein